MNVEKPVIDKNESVTNYNCPNCKHRILSTRDMGASGRKTKYCPECGKGIDWNGVKIEAYWPI